MNEVQEEILISVILNFFYSPTIGTIIVPTGNSKLQKLLSIVWKTGGDVPPQGCHTSGKSQGKVFFFKVREMSGNFEICQGKNEF